MATLVELDGVAPTIGADAWLAPAAVLIGDVGTGQRGPALRQGPAHRGGDAGSASATARCSRDASSRTARSWGRAPSSSSTRACTEGAMLAAGAVVAERGTVSPARARRRRLAREKKRLSASAERWTRTAAGDYSTETALRGSDAIGDDAGECVNLTRRHTPRARTRIEPQSPHCRPRKPRAGGALLTAARSRGRRSSLQ
jgi:hypothetical protein